MLSIVCQESTQHKQIIHAASHNVLGRNKKVWEHASLRVLSGKLNIPCTKIEKQKGPPLIFIAFASCWLSKHYNSLAWMTYRPLSHPDKATYSWLFSVVSLFSLWSRCLNTLPCIHNKLDNCLHCSGQWLMVTGVLSQWGSRQICADAASCLNTITITNCQGSLKTLRLHWTSKTQVFVTFEGELLELILPTVRTKKECSEIVIAIK